jgi:uncharacterized membrane protein YcgQ (UPF0703/DUF1980 family)
MKLPKVVETLLNDKNVLYIVAFLAIMNFFGYIILRDSYALLIFLSVGFISTYFSKNMTVVLLSTLLLTNFITVLSRNFVMNKEGFDATSAETESTEKPAGEVATSNTKKPDATKKTTASGVAGAGGVTNKTSKKVAASASSTAAALQKPNGQSEKNTNSTKEPMTELNPASLDDDDDLPVNNRVDYAKTMERAYDNLENLVGKDGVNGLTSQTNVLMEQQQKLMENMKSMEPLLKTAQSFLDKFESSSMGKLFEKIPGMSSMFGGAATGAPGGAAGSAAQNGNMKV